MDMDTYDTETHGKWRCILWRSRAFKIIFQICGTLEQGLESPASPVLKMIVKKLGCSSYLVKQQPFDIKFLLAILRRHSTHIAFNIKLHDNRWLELWSFRLWKPGHNQLEK